MNQQPEKKDQVINLRLPEAEKRAAFRVAKEEGKTVSEVIRDLLKTVQTTNQA